MGHNETELVRWHDAAADSGSGLCLLGPLDQQRAAQTPSDRATGEPGGLNCPPALGFPPARQPSGHKAHVAVTLRVPPQKTQHSRTLLCSSYMDRCGKPHRVWQPRPSHK